MAQDGTMEYKNQETIDHINCWVKEFKEDNSKEAATKLLEQFEPLIYKTCNRLRSFYNDVYPQDEVEQEARVIFYDLLCEYTIDGRAYFNVYMQRKLHLRLRYFFTKEINRKKKFIDMEDSAMEEVSDNYSPHELYVDEIDKQEVLEEVLMAIDNREILSEREASMVHSHFIEELSHQQIADSHEISRSRVSRIIKKAVDRLQEEVKHDE